ncbi:MAG: heavy metal-associated domain-containing protein [Verrucomicrobiota bacterium]
MRPAAAFCLVVLLAACGKTPSAPTAPEIPYLKGATVVPVKGMHCSACKAKVMRSLAEVDGVEWAQVEVELGEVAYLGNTAKGDIEAAIRRAGYQVDE